jgi:hypothetical protein
MAPHATFIAFTIECTGALRVLNVSHLTLPLLLGALPLTRGTCRTKTALSYTRARNGQTANQIRLHSHTQLAVSSH